MSDCGPVAALNVLKWAGLDLAYKTHIKHIKEECKYVNDEDFAGVRWWNLRDGIAKIGSKRISVRTYHVKRVEVLVQHLQRGGAAVLRYRVTPRTEDSYGNFHYSAIVPTDDSKKFVWINHYTQYPYTCLYVNPNLLDMHVKTCKCRLWDTPIALLVRKI